MKFSFATVAKEVAEVASRICYRSCKSISHLQLLLKQKLSYLIYKSFYSSLIIIIIK